MFKNLVFPTISLLGSLFFLSCVNDRNGPVEDRCENVPKLIWQVENRGNNVNKVLELVAEIQAAAKADLAKLKAVDGDVSLNLTSDFARTVNKNVDQSSKVPEDFWLQELTYRQTLCFYETMVSRRDLPQSVKDRYHEAILELGRLRAEFTFSEKKSNKQNSTVQPQDRVRKTFQNVDTVNSLVWLTRNLDLEVGEHYYWERELSNKERYGLYYTQKSAADACTSLGFGWRLPTIAEFEELNRFCGGSFFSLTEGPCKVKLNLFGSRYRLHEQRGTKEFTRMNEQGFYWTKDRVDEQNLIKYKAYVLTSMNDTTYQIPVIYTPDEALSCRCVKRISQSAKSPMKDDEKPMFQCDELLSAVKEFRSHYNPCISGHETRHSGAFQESRDKLLLLVGDLTDEINSMYNYCAGQNNTRPIAREAEKKFNTAISALIKENGCQIEG